MTNPLLTLGDTLPAFDRITAADVEPALRELLAGFHAGLTALEAAPVPTWDGTFGRILAVAEPLRLAWGVVGHLLAVRNTSELRTAHQAMQPEVVKAWLRLGQSRPLYDALVAVRAAGGLDAVQERIVDAEIRDMELASVGLTGAAQERYRAISLELSELGTRFQNHLLDAGKAFALDLTEPADIDGLPASLLAQTAAAAQAAGHDGWRITLDVPVFGPFMEHSRRRDLRERLYRAFITRASTGDLDNQPLMARILDLRREQAALLGKGSYAEVSLAAKMAGSVAAVDGLLDRLRAAAKPKAAAELAELTAFARARTADPALTLSLWDIAFWAERLREERYAYTDEELRPYFSLPRVLDGLFSLVQRLFGVEVVPAAGIATWHPSVQVFRILDGGREIALFYLDPFSRPADKRGGAWMDSFRDRRGARVPVAYLVCNQTPPVGETPSLMTLREVETLFHECGHGLQHLLTEVGYPQAAGINGVEWDAVELPSQFMENWCYDDATIAGLARHWQTGAPLPAELFARVKRARTYRAGSNTLRQVYLSTLDLELHHRLRPGEAPQDVQRRVAAANTILPPLAEDRFLCGFSHIFSGGYAAGYYSYKWAEVLSADAFSAFTEAGPARHGEIGRRFRATVLGQGGSRHPLAVFRDFRGREPAVEPLLVATGLA